MEKRNIQELVREAEYLDQQGNSNISKYVSFSLRETLEKIDAYLNSKHTSGETDSLGREKPFFNIVTAATNVWYRATDIDRKNIFIRATKQEDVVLAFLFTILLQDWMRKSKFGIFLNEWGRVLARYGSAVSKIVEKDGELYCEVVPWNRLIVDPIDFDNSVVIEKLWFTPAQLRKNKSYNQDLVEELIETAKTSRKLIGISATTIDSKDEFIPVYEVHGELPLSYLTGKDKDDDTYVQQMHVVTFTGKTSNNDEFNDFTLVSGREKKSPYVITHLIKEDGRTLAIGAVEHLFEAQWMVNHSVQQIKDQLDLASKIIFQTSDGNLVNQNVLTDIENGDILQYTAGMPITQLNNKPDIGAMQSFLEQWQSLGNQINGISEAMLGQNPPSGTAWRLQNAILQESHSLFELMTENKGLSLEEMLREFILPYLKKYIDTTDEISAILTDNQIKKIDKMYVPNKALSIVNEQIKKTVLSGKIYDVTQQESDIANVGDFIQKGLTNLGNQRFIKPSEIVSRTWKDVLKDVELELEIDITGESRDTQSLMTTLTTIFQSIASNPMILKDPNVKLVWDKILNLAGGISPLEIQEAQEVTPSMPAQMPTQPNLANLA